MPRVVSVGEQDFERLIKGNCFYVDKTLFIKEWWENRDIVTLITRPRRFGKTLNMNMLERFFSVEYKEQGEVFENLSIWQEKKYRELQGVYPVISLSFAGVKENHCETALYLICQLIKMLYKKHYYLTESDALTDDESREVRKFASGVSLQDAPLALYILCSYLYRHYGKKVIVLLDEYDTPIQEAYVNGYWEEMAAFTRVLFNNTFNSNPYLERAIMTGITRVSKESLFSDLYNLKVVSMTSNNYASCFGFSENEVFSAMDEFHMTNKLEVKKWYDGFTIGSWQDIYNPWSIINFLDEGELRPYWTNTSSNGLVSSLIRKGSKDVKMQFEDLLSGKKIVSRIEEEIIFNQLDGSERAIWSLLLAAGYLKVTKIRGKDYELSLTNYEVKQTFEDMVREWFDEGTSDYNDFVKALLRDDVEEMNEYMSEMAESMFSSFDGGKKPSEKKTPERFYHGFVLGLLVDLADRYEVLSNRESGFGRYDVMLKPRSRKDNGIIMEFKIFNAKKENSLRDTVQAALMQIKDRGYEQSLLDSGLKKQQIRKYGFAFRGKEVLIGSE